MAEKLAAGKAKETKKKAAPKKAKETKKKTRVPKKGEKIEEGYNGRKVMLLGRSECGKTTLIQALQNQEIRYEKTQSVNYQSMLLDTPGEYTQVVNLGRALAIFSYEVDVVGMVCSATEDHTVYAPNITPHINREVFGVVTKIDVEGSWPDAAEEWLRNAGCKRIFRVSSYTGEGIEELRQYLRGN